MDSESSGRIQRTELYSTAIAPHVKGSRAVGPVIKVSRGNFLKRTAPRIECAACPECGMTPSAAGVVLGSTSYSAPHCHALPGGAEDLTTVTGGPGTIHRMPVLQPGLEGVYGGIGWYKAALIPLYSSEIDLGHTLS